MLAAQGSQGLSGRLPFSAKLLRTVKVKGQNCQGHWKVKVEYRVISIIPFYNEIILNEYMNCNK